MGAGQKLNILFNEVTSLTGLELASQKELEIYLPLPSAGVTGTRYPMPSAASLALGSPIYIITLNLCNLHELGMETSFS